FDRWTMNDYYSFASFFPQVGRKQGEDPREYIVFDKGDGEVKHPVTGKPLPPKFLGAAQPEIKSGESRREVLAAWLASPENPHFAKNLANIFWAHFLGRGIIDPVDDVRISNPASNPELLDALGAKFTEYKYDFKRLDRRGKNQRGRPREKAAQGRQFPRANHRRTLPPLLRSQTRLRRAGQARRLLQGRQDRRAGPQRPLLGLTELEGIPLQPLRRPRGTEPQCPDACTPSGAAESRVEVVRLGIG